MIITKYILTSFAKLTKRTIYLCIYLFIIYLCIYLFIYLYIFLFILVFDVICMPIFYRFFLHILQGQ